MTEDRPHPTYRLVNPADGSTAGFAPDLDVGDVDDRVRSARQALFGSWRESTPSERADLLFGLAGALRERVDELAALETATNGKPISQTRGEIRKAASVFAHAATLTSHLSGRTIPLGGPRHALTFEEPIGVVAALVPWNSPLIIAAMMIGPALAAGCTVLVKPSPLTPLEALELEKIALEVGFPDGVVQVCTGQAEEIGKRLVEHPDVAKIAFTGSTVVGKRIAESAGRHLKSTLLELGGKSPLGVFPDADVQRAAAGVADGIILSGGQSCVTPSRLLVHEDLAEPLLAAMRSHIESTVVGSPLDPRTQMGPLSSQEHLARVRGFVTRALEEGCERTISFPDEADLPSEGCFHPVTVLRAPDPDVEVWREEVFGPVLAWQTFNSEDEFLAKANDTRYGLGAVVWTNDYRRVLRLAHDLQAGMVWINSQRRTEISAPFGGVKDSGLGRENGTETLREFITTKTLYLGME